MGKMFGDYIVSAERRVYLRYHQSCSLVPITSRLPRIGMIVRCIATF